MFVILRRLILLSATLAVAGLGHIAPLRAQAGPVEVTNASGGTIEVIAIQGENQTPLVTLAPGQSMVVPAAPGSALGFAANGAWVGEGYGVTGAPDESVTVPYSTTAAAPTGTPPGETTDATAAAAPPQESPEVAAARQRFQGPGSVEVQLTNPTGEDIAAVVSDEAGQGIDLFVVPAQQSVVQLVLPETQLFFFPGTSVEPIGQPYVVTAEPAQALTLPYAPLPPPELSKQPAESGVPIEFANSTADDIAVVSKEGVGLFTVGAQRTERHRVPPGTEIWFFPGQSETPVGKPYIVGPEKAQAIALPYDPAVALRQLHQGPGSTRVFITNSLAEPVTATVVDAAGGAAGLFDIPGQQARYEARFQPGTTVWFYTASSPGPVGDPVEIPPDTNNPPVFVVPYRTPSDLQISMSGPGSIELSFDNRSANQVIVATTDAENRPVDLGTVAANGPGTVRALPGTILWFYTAGSDKPDEHPYTVPDSPPSTIELPYRPRTAAAEQFLGKGTEVTFANPGSIPVTVAVKSAEGTPVELFVLREGETAKQQIPSRTMLWFYKPGMTEPYERPRPFFVPDAPATVQLPYNPTDEDIARMVGIDLDKITKEIINKVVADRVDAKTTKACWRDSYTRSVGTVPRNCPPGQEEATAGLCYDKCRPGYTGAVTMCVPGCPPGFRDDGLYCFKPAPYKRDEYPISAGEFFSFSWLTGGDTLQGARDRCRRDHGGNCVAANGNTIVYETCKAGYQQAPVITNLCTPTCPANTIDRGISCEKRTYDRGVGKLMSCDPSKQYDAGLCYDKCRPGFTGVGFVCWAACPTNLPVNCGASCAKSKDECALALTNQITSPFIAAGSIALTALTAGAGSAAVSSAKTAAQAGAQIAAKAAAKAAARTSLKAAVRAALRSSAGQFAKRAAIELTIDSYVGTTFATIVTAGIEGAGAAAQEEAIKDLKADVGKAVKKRMGDMVSDGQIDAVVDTAMAAAEAQAPAGTDFPWTALDPTGLADVVIAYNLPLCSEVK